MKRKLRSQSGASLILALLLFLVCAVVGSIVLTAGTAASGRLSEMAGMDQRYYAVTSAANMLGKELNGTQVTIVREKKVTDTYEANEDSFVRTGSDTEYVFYNPDKSEETSYFNLSFLTQQTVYYLFGSASPELSSQDQKITAWNASFYTPKTAAQQTFSLTFDHSDQVDTSALPVRVVAVMDQYGTLTLRVSNADSNGTAGRTYRLDVILVPSVNERTVTYTDSPVMFGDTTYTVTTTDTKTADVTWKLQGIKKVVS